LGEGGEVGFITMKYLLPWEPNDNGFVRKQLGKNYNHSSYCEVRVYKYYSRWYHTYRFDGSFFSNEDAMKDADKYMISRGWEILSEERAEKLRLLL
jgi:hypothetical protein